MALIPWRPGWLWEPWDELDKWFAARSGEPRLWREDKLPEMKSAEFIPQIDVYEKDNKIVVETSITGVDPEKIDVSVEDNTLILKGKSEKKSEIDEKDYYRQEVRYGSFYRAVGLPVKVIGDKAEANYEDGLLKVVIPKAAGTKEKKVKVKIKKSSK